MRYIKFLPYGTKKYYQDYLLHREDGPAVEYKNGDKEWYQYGKLHRKDGPAIEYVNSTKWYQNDLLHRDDGPALEFADGDKYWYYKGQEIYCSSQEEFIRLLKLKSFW